MLIHSYLTSKVKVIRSAIDRRGVFAVKPIRKGEIICVIGGHIITQKEYDRLCRKGAGRITDYALKVADGFYLVSCTKGGLEDDDFINHSCHPNTGFKGHLVMVALRNIRAKEEITYDYCMTDAELDYSFPCNCGGANCRKVITDNDWKIASLQKKYKGFFSWFIQDKIQNLSAKKHARR